MPATHHIQVGGQSWCEWTGCKAGMDINKTVGFVTCTHRSRNAAEVAARKLRPHFRRGAVKVVATDCEHAQ